MPVLFLLGGAAVLTLLIASAASASEGSGAKHAPDYKPDPSQGKTGYRRVDAILPDLREAAASSKIPLGLLIGWIAKESGGNIRSTTKYGEKGYFQLTPDEAASLGLDLDRLGTDSDYSINGGLLLVGKYAREATAIGVAPPGSAYYWCLVKLLHSMGSSAAKKVVDGARAAGAVGSWTALEKHAVDNDVAYHHATGHSPKKWFGLVDEVYAIGAPFGFESAATSAAAIVGEIDEEIPDPLALL